MGTHRIIDGDGHIFEDGPAIAKHIPDIYKSNWRWESAAARLFPPLDHLHSQQVKLLPGAFGGGKPVGPAEWSAFMSEVGIEAAVLYPTAALAHGKMVDYDWSIALTRAYNDWLHEAYLQVDKRFKGIALIPLQEPSAAAEELDRAVTELGMCGAMLPSTGLPNHLGSKQYWPVYAVADRLGCAMAVHGGAHSGFGMDHFNVYAPVHGLGHPFGQMVALGSMIFNGLCDRFPQARWGFLEGGVAWVLTCLERFDRSYETHIGFDLRSEQIQLRPGEKVSQYIKRQMQAGRIFIGCEGEEPALTYAVQELGAEAFVFSTDFPHEVTAEMCMHEIEELLENERISEDDKAAILRGNAGRFYKLTSVDAQARAGAAVAS